MYVVLPPHTHTHSGSPQGKPQDEEWVMTENLQKCRCVCGWWWWGDERKGTWGPTTFSAHEEVTWLNIPH